MDYKNLQQVAAFTGIDAAKLSFGAATDDAWCIQQTPWGHWEVFYYDRGSKDKHWVFDNEEAACYYFFGLVAYHAVSSARLVPAAR
jgi:hypothetical protein